MIKSKCLASAPPRIKNILSKPQVLAHIDFYLNLEIGYLRRSIEEVRLTLNFDDLSNQGMFQAVRLFLDRILEILPGFYAGSKVFYKLCRDDIIGDDPTDAEIEEIKKRLSEKDCADFTVFYNFESSVLAILYNLQKDTNKDGVTDIDLPVLLEILENGEKEYFVDPGFKMESIDPESFFSERLMGTQFFQKFLECMLQVHEWTLAEIAQHYILNKFGPLKALKLNIEKSKQKLQLLKRSKLSAGFEGWSENAPAAREKAVLAPQPEHAKKPENVDGAQRTRKFK
ncbi:MAG: hypothetical protein V4490_06340 [Pseudomonadota bacterium]